MSHGIEVRAPFMDWRLVTYSFALPETSKIGVGYTKRVLREAMRGILPEPIRLRTKKIGYVSPMESWARGALKPWLLDLSASRAFLESALWNGPMVRAAVERAADGKASIGPVWPILNAYVLEQSFKARARDITTSTTARFDRNFAI
jgi:asparagine synthase (glutamine-hydrolysing)